MSLKYRLLRGFVLRNKSFVMFRNRNNETLQIELFCQLCVFLATRRSGRFDVEQLCCSLLCLRFASLEVRFA